MQQSRATWAARRRRGLSSDPFSEPPNPDAPSDGLRDALLRLWTMRTADEAPDPATTSRCEACRKPLDTGVVVIELNAETMIALGGDPWTDLSRKYVFRTDCAQQARDLLDWLQREGGARR